MTRADRRTRLMPYTAMTLGLVIVLIVTGGCGDGRPVGAAPTKVSTPALTASATPTPTSPATASTAAASAAPSGLLAMTLTDVRSGETFSLAQFGAKVTIVQHMAVW